MTFAIFKRIPARFRNIAVILVFTAFASKAAFGAVSIDASSSGGAFNNAGVTNVTWNHTVGSGISRALYVGVSTTSLSALTPVCQVLTCQSFPPSGSFRVLSVEYGGTPLQFVGGRISADQNNSIEIFRLLSPPSGSAAVVVNISPTTSTHVVGGAVSFNGVDQSTPNSSFVSNTGSSSAPNSTFTGTLTGDMIFDTVSVAPASGYLAPAMDQTGQWLGRTFFSNSYDVGAGSTKPRTSSIETMTWTSTSSGNWVHGGVIVRSLASTAADGSVEGRVLTDQNWGIAGAIVLMTSTSGEVRSARTNVFGYFTFTGIPFGETYIVDVKAKSFVFSPTILTVNEDISKLELVAVGR